MALSSSRQLTALAALLLAAAAPTARADGSRVGYAAEDLVSPSLLETTNSIEGADFTCPIGKGPAHGSEVVPVRWGTTSTAHVQTSSSMPTLLHADIYVSFPAINISQPLPCNASDCEVRLQPQQLQQPHTITAE